MTALQITIIVVIACALEFLLGYATGRVHQMTIDLNQKRWWAEKKED